VTTEIRNSDSPSYGRAVSCPRCVAPPGQPCRSVTGQKTVAHWERVRSSAQYRAKIR